jgi:anti-sigma regulatory factor (Ser/Thr protein kinase)
MDLSPSACFGSRTIPCKPTYRATGFSALYVSPGHLASGGGGSAVVAAEGHRLGACLGLQRTQLLIRPSQLCDGRPRALVRSAQNLSTGKAEWGKEVLIKVPENFRHAGELDQRLSIDPRAPAFAQARLDVDLRECNFIRPAAVLWAAVYPLLAGARGTKCRLLVPENVGVCVYLKSVGLFELLSKNDVEVDDRGIFASQDAQLILPITRFNSEANVEDLANDALDRLQSVAVGAANLYPVVSEIFAELALNAVQHADSQIGAFGLIQFYQFGQQQRFVCTVADGGMGIRRSLERNPELQDRVPYDWTAIELAVQERISGTGKPTRGIGLFGVAEDMRKPGRHLIIHSGIGMLEIRGTAYGLASRTSLFPGTLASASIPT